MPFEKKKLGGSMHKLSALKRQAIFERMAHIGMHMGQLPVLEYIMRHELCTQSDIARAMCVTPASIALSTKRLQASGLLEKEVSEEDTRCNRLRVTERGRQMSAKCRTVFNSVDEMMFNGFTDAELEVCFSMLERMSANLAGENADKLTGLDILAMEHRLKEEDKC